MKRFLRRTESPPLEAPSVAESPVQPTPEVSNRQPRPSKAPATKVLVCQVGGGFDDLIAADAEVYERHCSIVIRASFPTAAEFYAALGGRFDLVHLFVRSDQQGSLIGNATGSELVAECVRGGVKLLWVGNSNPPEAYIKKFPGGPLNLVMTLERKDPAFGAFLDKLLTSMKRGVPIGMAWIALAPQSGSANHHGPEAFFFAGGVPDVQVR